MADESSSETRVSDASEAPSDPEPSSSSEEEAGASMSSEEGTESPPSVAGQEASPSVPAEEGPERYLNREITWLSFNERVLQEAMDPEVPLYDRLRFLAIFSSNLDEFFRVRVASLRSLLRLKKKKLKKLDFRPRRLLREIHFVVTSQQETFANAFRHQILPELGRNGIFLLNNRNLRPDQLEFVQAHAREQVLPHLDPQVLEDKERAPFLKEGRIYLVAELWPGPELSLASERPSYGIVEIPSPPLSRWIVIPGKAHNVLFLEDAIRLLLPQLFPRYEVGSAYSVKLSRDAELYLEDEFQGDLVERIRKSLKKRETGLPSRFLYDLQAPYALVAFMKEHLDLEDEDLVPGGRYHNLQDLFHFPLPPEPGGLLRDPLPPLPHPGLSEAPSLLAAVADRDRILHFPYQSYEYVPRFLKEAARDPRVERIWITLYRVAEESSVVKTLMEAAREGIQVSAFVEVKARFDEARNLKWAAEMEAAGVRTFYSKPGIKVHAKMALVSLKEGQEPRHFAYLATGNFNENTARVYADHGLLTADPRLTEDVEQVFLHLWEEVELPTCQHLLVAPFFLREEMAALVRREMEASQEGALNGMVLKANGLEDRRMIDVLYEASQADVRMNLIIRGICRLRPGLEGLSENIKARSIVDRFLEHARIYRFVNRGRPVLYLASADLMKRNLANRVEVAFPVFDDRIREELEHLLYLQLADNTKARVLDSAQANYYVGRRSGEPRVAAQEAFYRWLEAGGAKGRWKGEGARSPGEIGETE